MRRWITLLLLAVIAAGAAWTLREQGRKEDAFDPWRAIPHHAAVIIEIPDPINAWQRWTRTSQWWNTVRTLPSAAAIDQLVERTALAIDGHDASQLSASSLLIALVPAGNGDLDLLLVMPSGDGRMDAVIDAVARHLDATTGQIASMRTSPITLAGEGEFQGSSITVHEGLLMIAGSPRVMEDALLACHAPVAAQDSTLTHMRHTLGQGVDAHVLVNTSMLPRLLTTWFTPAAVDELGAAGGWAALDLSVRPEALLFSGVFNPSGPVHAVPGDMGGFPLSRALPAGVCFSSGMVMNDPQRWLEERALTTDDDAGALLRWSHGTITCARAAADSGRIHTWAVLRTEDPDAAWRALASRCPAAGCDTMRYRDSRMVQLAEAGTFERALGPDFADLERPWYTVLADEVVFSDDPAAVRMAIDAWIDGSPLAADPGAAVFFHDHSAEAARTWWCDVERSIPLLHHRLNATGAETLDAHHAVWNKLGGALMQASPSPDGSTFVTVVLEHRGGTQGTIAGEVVAPGDDPHPTALWTARLPAPVARKPDLLRNHVNGTRDVLVQDAAHNIHCFSGTGQPLWDRDLDGPIMGEVHQVDRFRNGKLQLLFNTEGFLYLIDRNGKDVPGFPVKMKEKATAPLSVFDYDGQRDYRILLPTAEARVIDLGIDGRPVDGWSAPALARVSNEPVRHLRIRGRDHLLVINSAGGIQVWDRRGAVRYRPELELAGLRAVLSVESALDIGDVRITWVDRAGVVRRASLNAHTSETLPISPAEDHYAGDLAGARTILATRGDSLWAWSPGKSLAMGFDAAITAPPMVYRLARTDAIGIVCAGSGQLHLIDTGSREIMGAPFNGAAPFSMADLNLDGRLELVTSDASGQIIVYSLPRDP